MSNADASRKSVMHGLQTHSDERRRDGSALCSSATATINVRNLRLRTFIGFKPEETLKQQDVVINIEIAYRIGAGILNDDVAMALDYKQITKAVIEHVESGRFLLLEKLVADVLAICSEPPSVSRAAVTIDKPHALRFADSVSLTLYYDAAERADDREDNR